MQIERDVRSILAIAMFVGALKIFLYLAGKSSVFFPILNFVKLLVFLI